ncbi:hypothetical protein ACFYWX_30675 [Streptomyces sp. NPDC002888]|uniref:hypothetical protein n=1 Tax=Streptomyces sp. NPDC002888 TaxID=3364668 RepID=UPI0036A45B93
MKRHVEFTERAGRLRDYLPPDDRERLLRLAEELAEEPYGPRTHLAFRNDEVTRSIWSDGLNVIYVVAWNAVVVVDTDIYDAARGFNEV